MITRLSYNCVEYWQQVCPDKQTPLRSLLAIETLYVVLWLCSYVCIILKSWPVTGLNTMYTIKKELTKKYKKKRKNCKQRRVAHVRFAVVIWQFVKVVVSSLHNALANNVLLPLTCDEHDDDVNCALILYCRNCMKRACTSPWYG